MSVMAVTSTLRQNTGSVPCLATPTHRMDRLRLSRNETYKTPPQRQSIDERSDTVVINVSGKRFETYLTTLKRFPNTLLGDPTKLIHFYNHATGEYFFDRHRKAFNGILYFYQSNGILERPPGVSESLFTQEALFFELSQEALEYNESVKSELDELDHFPTNPYLYKIWILFEQPNSSIGAKILAIVSVLIILLSITVFCVESIPKLNPETEEGSHMWKTWLILNSICNGWFTLEYLLRFVAAPRKMAFLRSYINIVDIVSIIPFYITILIGGNKVDQTGHGISVLKVIRVIRVIRIFKLTRHSRGLHVLANTIKSSSHELSMLALFLAIGVIVFSSAVYYAESQHRGTKFNSIPAGFWWAVVTMTTVGYGDLYPTTTLGKLIGTLCAISGVLVIALPVPVIVSNFEYYYKEEQCRQQREQEVIKKEKLDGKYSPMKQTMKMMAHASIVLAGGKNSDKESVSYNPQKQLQEKFQTKISFHMQKERKKSELDTYSTYGEDNEESISCSPKLFNSTTSDISPSKHPKMSNANGHPCRSYSGTLL